MEITILNLLFNYKGNISYREFRAGFAILSITALVVLGLTLFNEVYLEAVQENAGVSGVLSHDRYHNLFRSFIPALVPARFILSYSAFVIALKRVRALKGPDALGVISGLISFLFFASLLSLCTISYHYFSRYDGLAIFEEPLTLQLYALAGLFVTGLLNTACLSVRRKSETISSPASKERLDSIGYAIKTGNVIGVMVMLGLFIAAAAFFSLFDGIDGEILRAAAVLYLIVPFCFLIRYTTCRLRDAGVSIGWIIGIAAIYLLIPVGYMWIAGSYPDLLGLSSSLFEMAATLIIFVQYLLLLLPTQKRRRRRRESKTPPSTDGISSQIRSSGSCSTESQEARSL